MSREGRGSPGEALPVGGTTRNVAGVWKAELMAFLLAAYGSWGAHKQPEGPADLSEGHSAEASTG